MPIFGGTLSISGDLLGQICFLCLGAEDLALDDLGAFSSSKILPVCLRGSG